MPNSIIDDTVNWRITCRDTLGLTDVQSIGIIPLEIADSDGIYIVTAHVYRKGFGYVFNHHFYCAVAVGAYDKLTRSVGLHHIAVLVHERKSRFDLGNENFCHCVQHFGRVGIFRFDRFVCGLSVFVLKRAVLRELGFEFISQLCQIGLVVFVILLILTVRIRYIARNAPLYSVVFGFFGIYLDVHVIINVQSPVRDLVKGIGEHFRLHLSAFIGQLNVIDRDPCLQRHDARYHCNYEHNEHGDKYQYAYHHFFHNVYSSIFRLSVNRATY